MDSVGTVPSKRDMNNGNDAPAIRAKSENLAKEILNREEPKGITSFRPPLFCRPCRTNQF